jgi:hypothetical protein
MVTRTATALAGVSVVLSGAFFAAGRSFSQLSNAPPIASDLQALFDSAFQVAPIAGLLLAGLLIYQAAGGL